MTRDGYVVHEGCDHVVFVGFSGAGKSTVARRLGNWFQRGYVDVDRAVERTLHAHVSEIWSDMGEDVFRAAETEELKKLLDMKSLLVACGSGIVETPENLELLKRLGRVVYLKGTLEDSLSQIRSMAKRPDLTAASRIAEVYERRRPLYEQIADDTVVISGKSFEQVARECGALLWEEGLL